MGDAQQFDDLFVLPGTTWDPLVEPSNRPDAPVVQAVPAVAVEPTVHDLFVLPGTTWDPLEEESTVAEPLNRPYASVLQAAQPVQPIGTNQVVRVVQMVQVSQVTAEWVIEHMDIRDVLKYSIEHFSHICTRSIKRDAEYIGIMEQWDKLINETYNVMFTWNSRRYTPTADENAWYQSRVTELLARRDNDNKREMKRLQDKVMETYKGQLERSRQNLVQQIIDAKDFLRCRRMEELVHCPLWKRLHAPSIRQHWHTPKECMFWLVQSGIKASRRQN
jgi:hypothetical protein